MSKWILLKSEKINIKGKNKFNCFFANDKNYCIACTDYTNFDDSNRDKKNYKYFPDFDFALKHFYKKIGFNEYQGWTNYETWALMLHIDNERFSYNYYNEIARTIKKEEKNNDNVIYKLSELIKQEIENHDFNLNFVYNNLLNKAISEINFIEIAETLIERINLEVKQ